MTAGAVLADAGHLLARRPWLVLLAAAIVVPLDVLQETTGHWWSEPLWWLGQPIAQGAVAAAGLALLARDSPDLIQVLGVAVRRAPVVLVASIVSALGTAVGLVLLVFPGLVLFARWSVYVPVLIGERAIGLGLERSWELVKGRSQVAFWATLVPTLAGQLVVWMRFVFDGRAWSTTWFVAHPIVLTFSTLVAVVLYRWLVTVGESP